MSDDDDNEVLHYDEHLETDAHGNTRIVGVVRENGYAIGYYRIVWNQYDKKRKPVIYCVPTGHRDSSWLVKVKDVLRHEAELNMPIKEWR